MIGLDIGTRFIKMCEAQKKDGEYRIVSAVMEPVPEKGDISQEIKSIFERNKFSTKTTAISVGGDKVLVHMFDFPNLSDEELKSAIKLAAEQEVSYDLDTMDTDFQVIPSKKKSEKKVLYAAAPKEIVDRKIQIVQSANLDPVIMDIDNLASINCFLTFFSDAVEQTVMLVNVGHVHTNISILQNGKVKFAKNIKFGGIDISLKIEKELKVSFEEAEKIKKLPEEWQAKRLNIKNVLTKSTPDLLEAIYKSIEYCKSQKIFLEVDRVFLTGGTSCLEGLENFISEILGIKIQNWNPFLNIKGENKKELGQFMDIALGLSIRRLGD